MYMEKELGDVLLSVTKGVLLCVNFLTVFLLVYYNNLIIEM